MDEISVAKVLKPQGLKGELKCKSLTEKTEIFANLKSIFCDGKEINVISSVYRLGFVYILLENVDDIDKAEKFRNKEFFITKEQFGFLDENDYFLDDLIGIKLFDENEKYIGDIVKIENYGATDIIIVREGCLTFSVPFLKKIFYNIDIEKKSAKINSVEYEENKI